MGRFDYYFNNAVLEEKQVQGKTIPQQVWGGIKRIESLESTQNTLNARDEQLQGWYEENKITPEPGPYMEDIFIDTEGVIAVSYGGVSESDAVIMNQQAIGYYIVKEKNDSISMTMTEYLARKAELEAQIQGLEMSEILLTQQITSAEVNMGKYKARAERCNPLSRYNWLRLLTEHTSDMIGFTGVSFDEFNWKPRPHQEDYEGEIPPEDFPSYDFKGFYYKLATSQPEKYMKPNQNDYSACNEFQSTLEEIWSVIVSYTNQRDNAKMELDGLTYQLEQLQEQLERETDPIAREQIQEAIDNVNVLVNEKQEEYDSFSNDLASKIQEYNNTISDFKDQNENYEFDDEPQESVFAPILSMDIKKNIVDGNNYDEESMFIYKLLSDGQGLVVDPSQYDPNAPMFASLITGILDRYEMNCNYWLDWADRRWEYERQLKETREQKEEAVDELSKLKDPSKGRKMVDIECQFNGGGSFTIRNMLGLGAKASVTSRAEYEVKTGEGWGGCPTTDDIGDPPFETNKFVRFNLGDNIYRSINLNKSIKEELV